MFENEQFSSSLKVKIDRKIFNELSDLFPANSNQEHPQAIRMLFSGKLKFSFYLSNADTNQVYQPELKVNLLLATDIKDDNNALILQHLENSTLSIYAVVSEYQIVFTKALKVPRLVGSGTNRYMLGQLSFVGSDNVIAGGLPYPIMSKICQLPNTREQTEIVNSRLVHWDKYLQISEKIAKETQVLIKGSRHRITQNKLRLMFSFGEAKIQSIHINSTVKLVEAKDYENGLESYLGPNIGTIIDIDQLRKEMTVELSADFFELYQSGKVTIPQSALLFITKLGDLVQIARLRNGLNALSRGQTANRNLENFLFDSSKARNKHEIVTLIKENLLQPYLNPLQIKAIEGAIQAQDLYLIQGPPGTGKTTVIAEICYQLALRNQKTLIASQTNLAVDNALSKLVHHPKIRALRKGNEKSVQEEGILFVEDNVVGTWLEKTRLDCQKNLTQRKEDLEQACKARTEANHISQLYQSYNTAYDLMQLDHMSLSKELADQARVIKDLARLEKLQNEYNTRPLKEFLSYLEKTEYPELVECQHSISSIRTIIESHQQKLENFGLNTKILDVLVKDLSSIANELDGTKGHTFIEASRMQILDSSSNKSLTSLVEAATNLKIELTLLKEHRPGFLRRLFGWTKSWDQDFINTAKEYISVIREIDQSRVREKIQIDNLLLSESFSNSKQVIATVIEKHISGNRSNNVEIDRKLADIQRRIDHHNTVIANIEKNITEFHTSLPTDITIDSMDQIRFKEQIEAYYQAKIDDYIADEILNVEVLEAWITRLNERQDVDYLELKQAYINNANVIGITCNQSGSSDFTNQYPTFDTVIIDEVSKATPPELILPILKARSIVLIGDHRQLPPMIGMETYEEVASQLGISNLETDHMKNSLFEELYLNAPHSLKTLLLTQYRMHPDIMKLINQFYLDEEHAGLNCGIEKPDMKRKHNCEGGSIRTQDHAIWVDMPLGGQYLETPSQKNHSFSNMAEIDAIRNILISIQKNLIRNGFQGQKKVGIISFYRNQVLNLENEFLNDEFSNRMDHIALRIGSVDSFQGIECPIIICSFVRNNEKGDIGFARDPRRINVALSRAQELLFIVGCSKLFCATNRSGESTRIYNTIAQHITEIGGFRNALDF